MLFLEEEGYEPFRADAWLVFESGSGLALVWQSDEVTEDSDEDYRTTLLSPYCTELTYLFYDAEDEAWEEVTAADVSDEAQNQLPVFLRLTFESPEGEELHRRILLPAATLTPLPF